MNAVLVLLFFTAVATSKVLNVNDIPSLRTAIVNEGLESTLGFLSNQNSGRSQVNQFCTQIEERINAPLERYQRLFCNNSQTSCNRCSTLARSNNPQLRSTMLTQLVCRVDGRNDCPCTTNQAYFMVSAPSVAPVITKAAPSKLLNDFILAYTPQYQVVHMNYVGYLQRNNSMRYSTMMNATYGFETGVFEFGREYVVCSSLAYVTASDVKKSLAMAYYACKEFLLEPYALKSLTLLRDVYEQSNPLASTIMSNSDLAPFFAAYDMYANTIKENDHFVKTWDIDNNALSSLIAQRPRGGILNSRMTDAIRYYRSSLTNLENRISANNQKLDQAVKGMVDAASTVMRSLPARNLKAALNARIAQERLTTRRAVEAAAEAVVLGFTASSNSNGNSSCASVWQSMYTASQNCPPVNQFIVTGESEDP